MGTNYNTYGAPYGGMTQPTSTYPMSGPRPQFGDIWANLGGSMTGPAPQFKDKNAQGIANLGYESKAYGEDIWGRMMGGLQGALGEYSYGSLADYNNRMGNLMGQAGQPGSSSRALGDYRQFMFNGGPSSAYSSYLKAGNMYDQGNQGQQAYDQWRNQFGSPGATESFYAQNQNRFAGPSLSANMLDLYGSQLGTAGRTENLNLNAVNGLGNFAGQLRGMQGTAQIDQGAGEIGGYVRGADDVSKYFGSQLPALSGPGAYEQFVTADITGTNPLLERRLDESLARANQEWARRGGFKSGGAGVAIGNVIGEFAAQDYQNRADRARAAQEMELNRIGTGGQLAGASSSGKLAQGGSLQSLFGQQDTERRARIDQGLRAQELASNEAFRNNDQMMELAGMADQNRIARLMGLSNMAQGADQLNLGQFSAMLNAAGQSDAAMRGRAGMMFDQSNQLDQNAFDRAKQEFLMGQGIDAANLARYGMLGNLSGQADQDFMSRLGFQGNAAQGMFGNQLALSDARAGQYQPFYNMGGNFEGQAFENYMNAVANAYELQGNLEEAEKARKAAKSRSKWGAIGGGLGAIGGSFFGPGGAVAGYQIGSGIGSGLGG